MAEPQVSCAACGRVVIVNRYARGFPPDAAKRSLARLCKIDGHKAEPRYRAGFDEALRPLISPGSPEADHGQ